VDITQQYIDDVIIKEMTVDLSSGEFYTACDDETLEIALTSMWEDIEHWEHRGVILGEA